MLVNGERVKGAGDVVEVVNPATEEPIDSVPSASAGQVDDAVASANAALRGGRKRPPPSAGR